MKFDFLTATGERLCGGLTEASPAVRGDGKVKGKSFVPGKADAPRRAVARPTDLLVGEAVRVEYQMDDPAQPVTWTGRGKMRVPSYATAPRTYVLLRTA